MRKILLCTLLALGVIACTKDFIEPQNPQAPQLTSTRSGDDSSTSNNEGEIVLGQKLNNPYSVENINNTVQGLYGPVDMFDATHYYVRFLPEDSLDYHILLSDTTLLLFDYPLDYEITQDGDYYHDPSIPEDEITWQYTVVPVTYQFPSIRYEILEECFIPYDDFEPEDYGASINSVPNTNISINGVDIATPNSNSAIQTINIDFDELERQAIINSGNANMLTSNTRTTRSSSSKARSKGEVHIYDNSKEQMVALEGVMVITDDITRINVCGSL